MTTKLFTELGLSPELLKAIDKLGFEQVAPIQAETIPLLMAGRDVAGQSQTGSGKTAAFAIPAIEKADPQLRAVQTLILCPTRELAVQVAEEVHKLAWFKRGIHALPIYGGQSYDRQFSGLRQGAQIVIGTPGRIMDHMRRGTLRLDKVKLVVLDEVDVMLDMGFREDIEFILQGAPVERQTVFFSATIPRLIQELIRKYSRDPQNIRIEHKELTVPTVEQTYYEVDRRFKIELLTRLIDLHDFTLGIIFCNTKRMVDDLVDHLTAQGYSADRLHGDMSQAMRDRVMNKFRNSALEMLVATDVAARGIDVENVQVVFNYDLPYDVEDYLHRIGRTGRAGRSGLAISFAAGREVFQIHQIERYTRVKMQRGKPPTVGEVEEARTEVVLDKVRATLRTGEFKRQDRLIERLLEEGFTSTDIASALLHHLHIGNAAPVTELQREGAASRQERGAFGDRDRERRERAPREFSRPAKPERRYSRAAESEAIAPPVPKGPVPPSIQPEAPPPTPPSQTPPAAPEPGPVEQKAPPPERARKQDRPVKPLPPKPLHSRSTGDIPGFPKRREFAPEKPAPSPSHSRRTPAEQTRLYMNVGEEMGVGAGDVVGAILGETGLPADVVGTVDVRKRHVFVDVASEHANSIISKLKRAQIKGQRLKVKVA